MNQRSKRSNRIRRWSVVFVLALVLISLSGCQTFSFYRQAIKGQYHLFTHQQPIKKLVADPQTPERLRTQLQLLQNLRFFAETNLQLPVDGHYLKYVDVHRPYVVWNVEAAPEFSMEPKAWWYPLVGSLEYRGFFAESGATNYAETLRRKGFDVYVGGATAYSTLGWFKDPVLNTFVFEPEPDLAETIFHELGHQRVFARSDTDFNEAFATTVGQEGARRWLRARGSAVDRDKYEVELQNTRHFVAAITKAREQLAALYGDERTEAGKIKARKKTSGIPAEQLRAEKKRIIEQLRSEYATTNTGSLPEAGYSHWFARPVNNAQLNSVAAYYDLVPGFEQLLALNNGDLPKFYQAAERLAQKPKKERQQWLRGLGTARTTPSATVSTNPASP